jgi:hypothetical protein
MKVGNNLSKFSMIIGVNTKGNIIPIIVEVLNDCRFLIDGVVPCVDEGFDGYHTTFVEKTDQLN